VSIKIPFYKCQSAHFVLWNTSPDHYFKLLPRRCVRAFRLPFFSGFSPNVGTFISPNLHFSFITKYNSVPIPNYRQVQFPLQQASLFLLFGTCSQIAFLIALSNCPSLITFFAKSTLYSTLKHSSRSALIKGTRICNFLQRRISRFFDILEEYPDRWPSCLRWIFVQNRIACNS